MVGGSGRFLAAMSLLLAMGQRRARPPSPEAAAQKGTRSAASTAVTDSSRAAPANTLPPESTGGSTFAAAGAGKSAVKDCDALPLAEKEACYASYDEAALAECEQVRLYSCAPYARVHLSEVELKQVSEALLQGARNAYTSYEDNQPGYVKDVDSAYAAADSAWRAYRDAHCTLGARRSRHVSSGGSRTHRGVPCKHDGGADQGTQGAGVHAVRGRSR